jgi:hypothetical protein
VPAEPVLEPIGLGVPAWLGPPPVLVPLVLPVLGVLELVLEPNSKA